MKLQKNVYSKVSFKVIEVFWKIWIFHTLFSKSAIIYKEIPINCNFRLTSFGKNIINQIILKQVTQKLVKRCAIG